MIDDGFIWSKTELNNVLCDGKPRRTTSGEVVKVDKVVVDMLVFKDKNGKEFSYPIGATKDDGLFSSIVASEVIDSYPPYLKRGIKRVSFHLIDNPLDPFWREEYKNPGHKSAASDGGNINFWNTPKDKDDFKGITAHEAGHILDGDRKDCSSSKAWQEAVSRDDVFAKNLKGSYRVSEYAKTNDGEDFAECIKAYIIDHDNFKKYFPYRAAYIRKMAQQQSGHSPKSP